MFVPFSHAQRMKNKNRNYLRFHLNLINLDSLCISVLAGFGGERAR